MSFLGLLLSTLLATCRDVVPIAGVILLFQLAVLRRPISQWQRVLIGFAAVILGLTFFLVGLELALFPLGQAMARQLAAPEFLVPHDPSVEAMSQLGWYAHFWTYLFAFAIGFSATLAEPALLAVAIKAREVSGGTLHVWPLRIAVALGAGTGVMLGTLRIVLGVPLPYFLMAGYAVVIVQTFFAPRAIIPLAYDSGGVTTS
ncbi:MAG: DUF1538 domain-containing protein, partial [Gemmataceae bacterium]